MSADASGPDAPTALAARARPGAPPATIGTYRIDRRIGAGGMGEVWSASDERLQRRVAIKFLSPALTVESSRLARFHNEARAASALNHPNILTVHELGETGGTHYLVTELVEGTTLRDRLGGGTLPPGEAVAVAKQVAAALAAAHAAGVIHRDIKPDNVMVRGDGLVKVLDFGLAKLVEPGHGIAREPLTREGTVVGTPGYMSPEQLRGEAVDARTDVWSFGVMLYEMVTGRRPFVGPDANSVVARILHDDPPPARSLQKDLPPALERLLTRALSKERRDRHPSASAVLEELRAVERELLEAPAPPAPRRVTARAMAAAAVAGVLLLAGGIVARVLLDDAGVPAIARPEAIRSVAVLPFANLSGEAENEPLSDGMTEALIHAIGQVPGLKVISRTSTFALKGKSSEVTEVAERLGVGALVDGSVMKSGRRLRVTAQLVSAADGSQLWSEVYDRDLTDVFAIQHEIATAVARALATKLGGKPIVIPTTRDMQAYEMYLRGRQATQRWSEAAFLDRAIAEYRNAIARDPAFAAAWAGLADAYSMMDHRGGLTTLEPADTYRLAQEAADRALALDPNSAEAIAALGHIQTHRGEFPEAERNLRRAIALDPNSSWTRVWYAALLKALGRMEEQVEELRRVRDLDPLSILIAAMGTTGLWQAGEYQAAVEYSREGLRNAPDYAEFELGLARGLAFLGRADEADAAHARAAASPNRPKRLAVERGLVLAATGRRAEAIEVLRNAEKDPAVTSVSDRAIPLIRAWAAAGDSDKAAEWLDEAVEKNPYYARVNIGLPPHPLYAAFLADPRYLAARRKLGLPDLPLESSAAARAHGTREGVKAADRSR